MYRVLLVNHDSGMHSDLNSLFEDENCQDFELDEVETGVEALRLAHSDSYNLIIINLTIPNTDMLGLIGKLKVANSGLPILIYSKVLEFVFVKRYLITGANGYCFFKQGEADEMLKAIQTIISGKWYISPEMVELIVEEALYSKKTDRLDSLDEREFEIFTHLVKGETPASIAETLSVHATTIYLYKSRIMDKLRVTNFLEMKRMMNAR